MSNQINITNISFVSTLNGEDVWGHGLPFSSFETLVAKAKANASVSKLAVFPAHLSAAGNGRYVPETKSAIYRGQRSQAGNWYATVNVYNVGAVKKAEVPQEVAKPEASKLAEFKVLGYYQGQAVCLCVKSSPLFTWGKLYFDMDENRLIPSKEMASIKAKMSAEPQPVIPTPKEEYDALAIQIAEDLVAEKVAAKPRKTGQTYNGKVVWFSEEDQVYYTLSKKSDGKMGRDLVSIQELRERGKITMGKK